MSLKRAFDVVFAAVAIAIFAPIMLLIAALIILDSGGPVLFVQARVGRGGETFPMLKFRTMRLTECAGGGALLTAERDSRHTPFGRWLHDAHLDELPQLFNVLTGDMSIVGPRPELPPLVARYSTSARRVLAYRPGLTDPATLAFRDEARMLSRFADPEAAYLEEIMPRKVALSLEYAERANLRSDARVMWQTASALLQRPRHALETGREDTVPPIG